MIRGNLLHRIANHLTYLVIFPVGLHQSQRIVCLENHGCNQSCASKETGEFGRAAYTHCMATRLPSDVGCKHNSRHLQRGGIGN